MKVNEVIKCTKSMPHSRQPQIITLTK